MRTVLWKNATPEQINFWNLCNGLLAGWNTITPLFYQGAIAGSEFLTYNVAKLYIALELDVSTGTAIGVNECHVNLHNMADAAIIRFKNNSIALTAADVANFAGNTLFLKNVYFSRIDVFTYDSMRFNGYRLNVV